MKNAIYRNRQQGATLITALIMLIVLTLLSFSGIRSSTINLSIANNTQLDEEAVAAAERTTELVISSNFTKNPAASTAVVVVGNSTVTVAVPAPACHGSTAILNSSLDPTNPDDLPCFSSSGANNTGVLFVSGTAAANTMSWCYAQKWDVQAQVNDAITGANVTTHQGVSLKVPAGTSC